MSFIYLLIAIIAEVIATSALKASNGFTELVPIIFTVLGYAMWSAAGIVLISCVGWIVFKQNLDLPAMIGLAFILLGIVIINVFSKSTEL